MHRPRAPCGAPSNKADRCKRRRANNVIGRRVIHFRMWGMCARSSTIRGRGGVLENGRVLWYRFLLRIFMRFDHKPSVEYKYLRLDFETSKQQRQQTLHCASKATTAATEIANPRPKITLKARPRFKHNLKLEMIWTPTSRSKANPIMKPKRKPRAKTTNKTKPRLKPGLKEMKTMIQALNHNQPRPRN